MQLNLKNIAIGTLILITSFFLGRCTAPVETKTVTITIPGKEGKSSVITDFVPIYKVKDSMIYNDTVIYTENPFNKELAEKYTRLENEKDKLLAYLNSIQIRTYSIPYENDTLKIVGNIKVQGELKSVQYDWKIKSFKTDVDFKVPKPSMNLLVGGTFSNTVELDKFNFNATLGLQRKNGDLILGSYGVFDKSIQAGYLFNIKL